MWLLTSTKKESHFKEQVLSFRLKMMQPLSYLEKHALMNCSLFERYSLSEETSGSTVSVLIHLCLPVEIQENTKKKKQVQQHLPAMFTEPFSANSV